MEAADRPVEAAHDASDDDLLLSAGIQNAQGVFAVTGDDSRNLMIVFTAKQLNPRIRIVARCHEVRNAEKLRKAGAEVWIWSGRSDECKTATVEWLQRHGCFGFPTDVLWAWPFGAPERFRMRKAGDYRDDVVVKREWLSEIEPPEWARLTAVFDDRDRVVQMWRAAGVACFQVAPGEF